MNSMSISEKISSGFSALAKMPAKELLFLGCLENALNTLQSHFPTGESIDPHSISEAFQVPLSTTETFNYDKLGRIQAVMQVIVNLCFQRVELNPPDLSQCIAWAQPDAREIFMGNNEHLIVRSEGSSGSSTLSWEPEQIKAAFLDELAIAFVS